jgi:hypothetical protein
MVSADPHAWITLQRAIIGYRLSFALGVAARLGIADLLRDGPRPVEELATASGSNADALRRVLRLLASEGYFEERDADMFALTVAAELLRSDVVGSMRERAIIEAEEWARAWADLGHSVATGQPSFERQFGTPLFDYYRREPAAAARFDAAMTSMTTHVTPAPGRSYGLIRRRDSGRRWWRSRHAVASHARVAPAFARGAVRFAPCRRRCPSGARGRSRPL